MNVFDAIKHRRSYRDEFQNRPLEADDLNQLIEAARWAPSPFNVQPWELLIIQEPDGKAALAEVTETAIVEQFKDAKFLDDNSRWMRLTEAEWEAHGDGVLLTDHVTLPKPLQNDPEKLKPLLKNAKSLSFLGHLGGGKLPAKEIAEQVRNASLLMLVTMNCKRYPPGEGATRWMWLSMGMSIQNMLLTATALGIGVQFVSAPLESESNRDKLRNLFNIPASHEVITLLRIGYIDLEANKRSVRVPPSDFVHFEKVE